MEIEKESDRWKKSAPIEEHGFFEAVEIRRAVGTGTEVFPDSSKLPPVKRAQILRDDSYHFSAPHVLSQNTSGACFDFLLRRNAERHVERTRPDEGRQKKHNGQNAQNCPGEAGNGVCEV